MDERSTRTTAKPDTGMGPTLWLFDLDGTLCSQGTALSGDMRARLKAVRANQHGIHLGVISSNSMQGVLESLGPAASLFEMIFAENGLVSLKPPGRVYCRKLKPELLERVRAFVDTMELPVTLIAKRASICCDLSACPEDKRAGWQRELARRFRMSFADQALHVCAGTASNLEIFPHGATKAAVLARLRRQGFRHFSYVGDQVFPGGNDFEIATHPEVEGFQVHSTEGTLWLLGELARGGGVHGRLPEALVQRAVNAAEATRATMASRAGARARPSTPSLTVLIPCHDHPAQLRRTLACLEIAGRRARMDRHALQVLLIDNNSSEDLQPVWREFRSSLEVSLILRPQMRHPFALCSARNLGLKLATGQWVVFLDSDCLVTVGYLERLQKYLGVVPGEDRVLYTGERRFVRCESLSAEELKRDPRALSSLPLAHSASNYGLPWDRRFPEIWHLNDDAPLPEHPWALVHGGNLIIRRDDALAIGGFDESFDGNWGYEDTDFAYRFVTQLDGHIRFLAPCYVYHQEEPASARRLEARCDKVHNPNWKRICARVPGLLDFKRKQYERFSSRIMVD